MAPLPANNTAVLFVDYETSGAEHQIQCRYGTGATAADAMTSVASFLAALGSEIQLLTVLGARSRAAGATVTVDEVWSGAATYGATAGTKIQGAWFFDFIGRSVAGRRARVSVFGAAILNDGDDYRSEPGESAAIAAAQAVLAGATTTFVAIDGAHPVWKTYANTGANAYWRNKIR